MERLNESCLSSEHNSLFDEQMWRMMTVVLASRNKSRILTRGLANNEIHFYHAHRSVAHIWLSMSLAWVSPCPNMLMYVDQQWRTSLKAIPSGEGLKKWRRVDGFRKKTGCEVYPVFGENESVLSCHLVNKDGLHTCIDHSTYTKEREAIDDVKVRNTHVCNVCTYMYMCIYRWWSLRTRWVDEKEKRHVHHLSLSFHYKIRGWASKTSEILSTDGVNTARRMWSVDMFKGHRLQLSNGNETSKQISMLVWFPLGTWAERLVAIKVQHISRKNGRS